MKLSKIGFLSLVLTTSLLTASGHAFAKPADGPSIDEYRYNFAAATAADVLLVSASDTDHLYDGFRHIPGIVAQQSMISICSYFDNSVSFQCMANNFVGKIKSNPPTKFDDNSMTKYALDLLFGYIDNTGNSRYLSFIQFMNPGDTQAHIVAMKNGNDVKNKFWACRDQTEAALVKHKHDFPHESYDKENASEGAIMDTGAVCMYSALSELK
jgi:hypothetical protein